MSWTMCLNLLRLRLSEEEYAKDAIIPGGGKDCSNAEEVVIDGLAFPQVWRLFEFREANVLYSVLSVLLRVQMLPEGLQ